MTLISCKEKLENLGSSLLTSVSQAAIAVKAKLYPPAYDKIWDSFKKWSGVQLITKGVQQVRVGNYRQAAVCITSGSACLITLAAFSSYILKQFSTKTPFSNPQQFRNTAGLIEYRFTPIFSNPLFSSYTLNNVSNLSPVTSISEIVDDQSISFLDPRLSNATTISVIPKTFNQTIPLSFNLADLKVGLFNPNFRPFDNQLTSAYVPYIGVVSLKANPVIITTVTPTEKPKDLEPIVTESQTQIAPDATFDVENVSLKADPVTVANATPSEASKDLKPVVCESQTQVEPQAIPCVPQKLILSETINSQKGAQKVTVITAYDDTIKDYAQYVIPNQRAFAKEQGYNYVEYHGNLALDQGRLRAPYWSKIVALHDQLQKTKEGEWIAWVDASAIFTNTKKNFDEIIQQYGVDKDIILTSDPQVPINNAVFLIKNTPWTKEWIQKIWSRSDLSRGGEGNCFSWGQPFCHYEQQAMTQLWERDEDVKAHTALLANKVMNSFYRYSHYDEHRKLQQNYDNDPIESKWTPGDFICKVTGMSKDRRLAMIQHVIQNCIDTTTCELIQS